MNWNQTNALSPIERQLKQQVQELRQQLAILERTLDDLAKLRVGGSGTPVRSLSVGQFVPVQGSPTLPLSKPRQATSVWQAAKYALEDVGHPLQVQDLCPLLGHYGRPVGGENPIWNLSNNLSGKKDLFYITPWRRQKCWWLKDRPIPEE